MLNWPAIVKHSGDSELVYIRDQSQWDNDEDIHRFVYDESDVLIDVSGEVYGLTSRQGKQIHPESRGESMSLQAILGLIKAHAADTGACCVAKLYAPTLRDAFNMLDSLNKI